MKHSVKCSICLKGPLIPSNMYKHMREIHGCNEQEMELFKKDTKPAKSGASAEFSCGVCGKAFSSANGRMKHMKTAHDDSRGESAEEDEENSMPTVLCPGCNSAFHKNIELAKHCQEQHSSRGGDCAIVEKQFSSMDAFESWKRDMERKTSTRLSKGYSRRSVTSTSTSYRCHYAGGDGEEVDAADEKQRFRRSTVRKSCPCFLKLTKYAGDKVRVVACFGHYGHVLASTSASMSAKSKLYVEAMPTSQSPPVKRSRVIIPALRTRNLKNHRDALTYYKGKENLIVDSGNQKWKVASEKNHDLYCTVSINSPASDCDERRITHCERCGACEFRMSCDCPDGQRVGVSCIHVHAVATFVAEARKIIGPVLKSFACRSGYRAWCCSYVDSFSSNRILPQPQSSKDASSTNGFATADTVEDIKLMESYRKCKRALASVRHVMDVLYNTKRLKEMNMLHDLLQGALDSLPRDVAEAQPTGSKAVRTSGIVSVTARKPLFP